MRVEGSASASASRLATGSTGDRLRWTSRRKRRSQPGCEHSETPSSLTSLRTNRPGRSSPLNLAHWAPTLPATAEPFGRAIVVPKLVAGDKAARRYANFFGSIDTLEGRIIVIETQSLFIKNQSEIILKAQVERPQK